jgi:hypothetical protein
MKRLDAPIFIAVSLVFILILMLFLSFFHPSDSPHYCTTAAGSTDARCTGYFVKYPWAAPATTSTH